LTQISPHICQVSLPSLRDLAFALGRQRQVWFIPLAEECGVCR